MSSIDTDMGPYDALPARDSDDPPAQATHTVFRDGGSIAGYASADAAWNADCRRFTATVGSLEAAAGHVAERDATRRKAEAQGTCRCTGCPHCIPCCCTG